MNTLLETIWIMKTENGKEINFKELEMKKTDKKHPNFFVLLSAVILTVILSLGIGVLMGDIPISNDQKNIVEVLFLLFGILLFMLSLVGANVLLEKRFPALQKTPEQIKQEEDYYNRKRW